MTRRFERAQLLVGAGFRIRKVRADVNKRAIVGIILRRAQRLAFNRNDTFTELAGRLRDKLFGPRTERLDGGVRDDRELVASVYRKAADSGAKTHARRLPRLDGTVVGVHRTQRAIEQQIDVVAGNRRRSDADKGERRIPAANVRVVLEIGAELHFYGFFVELRSRIGDRGEVTARR